MARSGLARMRLRSLLPPPKVRSSLGASERGIFSRFRRRTRFRGNFGGRREEKGAAAFLRGEDSAAADAFAPTQISLQLCTS